MCRNSDILLMTHTGLVTYHRTCGNNDSKRKLCPICLYWDPRPEDGSGPGMGYCTKRDTVTLIRCECEYFDEATRTKVEARNRKIYGEIPEEEEGEE